MWSQDEEENHGYRFDRLICRSTGSKCRLWEKPFGLGVAMTFEELAWGDFSYRLVTNYDLSYRKLFAKASLLMKLQQNPGAVSPDEFKDSVITFLNEWGGRHIRNDADVAEVLLNGLNELQDKFQSLSNDILVTINFEHKGKLIQEIFDYLRWISWENNGPSRSVTVHLGATFASKLAHIMNPSLFVMWDNAIASHFWQHKMIASSNDYVGFLKLMQEEARSVISDFQASVGNGGPALFLSGKCDDAIPKALPKFLDEYNWLRSQRNLDTACPPEWLIRLSKSES